MEALNFTEMFDGSLSTTFVKTVWRFLHIDGSQIEKSAFPKNGVSRKVVDNHRINISAKFEACILKTFREKSFLAHIDCSQIEKWPQNGQSEF